MLTLSNHFVSQMSERANLDKDSLIQFAKMITPLVKSFDTRKIHQVAVIITELPKPVTVGYSTGDRLIFTVDIRTRMITTGFVRFRGQGMPKACQVMITLEGEIVH